MAAARALRLGRMCPSSTALLVCDVQERFRPLICGFGAVAETTRRMVKGAGALGLPILATEQAPEKLGATIAEVELPEGVPVIAKTSFSMLVPPVQQWLRDARPTGGATSSAGRAGAPAVPAVAGGPGGAAIRSVMIVGIEAHVCVLQTALDLLDQGYDVHLVADGVSSQRASDRAAGLARAAQSGAFLTTSEAAMFELCGSAKHPAFKQISALARERPAETLEQVAAAAMLSVSAKL